MNNDKKDNKIHNDKTNHRMLGVIFAICSLTAFIDFIKFTTGYYNPSKISIGIYILIAMLMFLSGFWSEFEKSKR